MLNLIFLCCDHSSNDFKNICEKLGVNCNFISSSDIKTDENREKIRNYICKKASEGITAVLFSNAGMNKTAEEFYVSLPKKAIIIPLGSDAILLNGATADSTDIEKINRYTMYGGDRNIENCIKYILREIGKNEKMQYEEPEELPFDGIYTSESSKIYYNLKDYFAEEGRKYPYYIGILSHRSSWIKNDIEPEKAIAKAFNKLGIGAICAYSYGADESIKSRGFREIMDDCFSVDGSLVIDLLINFQMFLLKSDKGKGLSEAAAREFSRLDIPVISPVNPYNMSYNTWINSDNPMGEGISTTIYNAEMEGMIEPIIVSTSDGKKHKPLMERIDLLSRRCERYIRLRHKDNSEKKIAIILHNSVCSGVEATIGKAYGLDSFETVVEIMKRLRSMGYSVNDFPMTGRELLDLIMERKAISDFRWTGVNDIAASGGVLYRMSAKKEYVKYYSKLTESSREYMEKTWGAPPGEGMVIGDDIIITGLDFGNVVVMVQPKRGCYGAKCTGEVCKILHDPQCPPPHQYLATYKFIEDVFDADAVIHTGTDGSLEYLPGKANCLSENCWPDIVLGSLVNFYIYNTGVTGESMIAKRRAKAVLLGYLPMANTIDENSRKLLEKIDEYFSASDLMNDQKDTIKKEVEVLLKDYPISKSLADENFDKFAADVKDKIKSASFASPITDKHIFGSIPDDDQCIDFMTEVWTADGIISRDEYSDFCDYRNSVRNTVKKLLYSEKDNSWESRDIEYMYTGLLRTNEEMDNLMSALNGEYVQASECGMPDENGRNIIPTGRNFCNVSTGKIPTEAAYSRGKEMAEQLLTAYLKDEGRYPEKIAMNMISTDITRTKGEQLSEVLYLLGVKPVWDKLGRVMSLDVLPVSVLKRPRIDVTVRISGVMRDTWGFAVDMMDTAVMLVSALDESDNDNFIRLNMRKDIVNAEDRSKTIRIFGDPPGTYGSGMDLALKASAWKDEEDLAKYFISYSAFAYGNKLNGRKSVKEFVENAKQVDLTCDTTSDRRNDVLSCGFGAGVQGGYRLIAKTFGKKDPKQYQSTNVKGEKIATSSLSQHMENSVNNTLLNSLWLNKVMGEGYEGASEIMHRIQNLFETQCSNECISDEIFDEVAKRYINDENIRQWLLDNNKYAAEEIARRLLELCTREKWKPDKDIFEELQNNYLYIEGDMESGVSGLDELQGGSVEVIADDQVNIWNENLKDIEDALKNK